MRKIVSAVAACGLLAAGAAFAGNCPNVMKDIDAKLATKPALSKDNMEKVSKLRAQGEADHKAGKHAESMKALADAKKILGM